MRHRGGFWRFCVFLLSEVFRDSCFFKAERRDRAVKALSLLLQHDANIWSFLDVFGCHWISATRTVKNIYTHTYIHFAVCYRIYKIISSPFLVEEFSQIGKHCQHFASNMLLILLILVNTYLIIIQNRNHFFEKPPMFSRNLAEAFR